MPYNYGYQYGYMGSGSIALAHILYNMDILNVTTELLRTIDNAGLEGEASDGKAYGSNHIFLDGSTQSVDYVTVSGSDYVYFDVTTKIHVSGTAIGATTNITASHSNFTSLKGGATVVTADKTYLDAHPESVARLVDGETVSELSFDLTDIEAFYPGNEGEASGAYVQDVKTALGSELLTSNMSTAGTGSITLSDITPISCTATHDGGTTNTYIDCKPETNLAQGKYYSVIVEVSTISGVLDSGNVQWYYGAGTRLYNLVNGKISFIEYMEGTPNFYASRINLGTTTASVFSVTATIKEATVAEIINYASTCRTNLDLTNYGASNLLYKQDATGRWLSMADANLIEFKNNTYATIDWKPLLSNFSLGIVFSTTATGTSGLIGQTIALGTGDRWGININSVGDLRFQVLGLTIIDLLGYNDGNLHMASISVDRAGNVVVWVDNVLKATYDISSLSATTLSTIYSNTIGAYNDNTGQPTFVDTLNSTIGKIIIEKNTIWDSTVQSNVYASAKLIYPTLP